jgi:hypothetical protein
MMDDNECHNLNTQDDDDNIPPPPFDNIEDEADIGIAEKEDYWDCDEEHFWDLYSSASEFNKSSDESSVDDNESLSHALPHKEDNDIMTGSNLGQEEDQESLLFDPRSSEECLRGEVLPCSYGAELDRHIVEPSLTPGDNAGISLMQQLRSQKTSLILYDKIIKWMQQDVAGYNCGTFEKIPGRKELLNKLRRLFPNCGLSNTRNISVDFEKKTKK